MTQQQYFSRLQSALQAKLNESDACEVLADYEGFFAEKRAEGLDDAQICVELGEPEQIAEEMARELGGKAPNLRVPYAALVLILFAFYSFAVYPFIGQGGRSYLIITSLAALLAGRFLRAATTPAGQSSRAWLFHLILFGIVATKASLPVVLILSMQDFGVGDFKIWYPVLDIMHYAYPLAALVVALLEIRLAKRESTDSRPVVLHAVAAICGMSMIGWSLYRLSTTSAFYDGLLTACAVYAILVCVCVLAPRVIRRIRGLQ